MKEEIIDVIGFALIFDQNRKEALFGRKGSWVHLAEWLTSFSVLL